MIRADTLCLNMLLLILICNSVNNITGCRTLKKFRYEIGNKSGTFQIVFDIMLISIKLKGEFFSFA